MKKDFLFIWEKKKLIYIVKEVKSFNRKKTLLTYVLHHHRILIPKNMINEKTQSFIKYPTQSKWVNGFLKKTIQNCYNGLKNNCYMLINI